MHDQTDELRQPDGLRFITVESDEHWQQYDAVATRSYGHSVGDILLLRHHADLRIAVARGEIAAGGLSLIGQQYFGGKPVPAALLGAGCVAPEHRGSHLSTRLITERLRPLQEQGAVLATLWTAATGHVQRMGWTAPVQAFSWTVPTDELRRSFTDANWVVTQGRTHHSDTLQHQIAARWNGPWKRPSWWNTWLQAKHPGLTTYEFRLPHHAVSGSLSVAFEHHHDGRRLVVHDFWPATAQAAAAMLAFLGRHNSRIPTIDFQRTALPPAPLLLHHLHRAGSVTAQAGNPWLLRVLDLRKAVRLRGWPADADLALPIEVTNHAGDDTSCFSIRIHDGTGELEPSGRPGHVTLTQGQFAVWYAGGYRTTAAALLSGVHGDPAAVRQLIHATSDQEPWMADHF
ncbi:enhanced intracellular survival protein Eis [Streptomyces sp. NPDC056405]|uniref:GNAT family N-acetyltransferase n=1 Tax=Streptomyces sp. NPDC056405 TaxID=3345811 RepID=UPI0035D5AEF9